MQNLKENEVAEQLGVNDLQIIQNTKGYRFTTDAVLLANFLPDLKDKKLADLGCGSGIISILAAAKKNATVVAVELQPPLADMAQRSVEMNNMQRQIQVVCEDIKSFKNTQKGVFDAVVCNPPYQKQGSGFLKKTEEQSICKAEIAITLAEIIESASVMLKNKGELFLVHQSQRLAEIFYLCKQYGLEPKNLCTVTPREGECPNLVLVSAKKKGGVGLSWKKGIVVFDKSGKYTTTVKQLYGEE